MSVGDLIRARRASDGRKPRFRCCKCEKRLPADRKDRYCRECRRHYQREWHREMTRRSKLDNRREGIVLAFTRSAP